jgi:predicted methyltransferase
MAIPFLNNINLSDNQLLNAKAHVTSTAPTAAKGQIYLDSSDNILKYHNGTTWISLVSSTGGTVTNVSSATTGQLTVANGTTTPILSIVTAPVSNGSSGLVTGDQVYDFVVGQGYLTTAVTSLTAGTGISVSASTGSVTVTNTDLGSSQNIFKNFAVSGQSTVVADSNNDTLTLVAGSNVTITTNATTDTITIASIDTNTTYDLNNTSVAGGSSINLIPSSGVTDSVTIRGTANEVEVIHSTGAIEIGLPNDVTIAGNLTVIGTTTTNNVETVSTSNGVIFEGTVVDANQLTLLAGVLTADRTVTLPDASGTVALTSNIGNGTLTVTAGTLLSGGGSFTANQSGNSSVTINHAAVSRTNNTSSQSPGFGGTFTVIDSVTTSTEGHVTAVNTKTVTMPSNSANTFATTITNSATVTHGLNTRDVIVQLFDTVTYETIYADVTRTTVNTVTIVFASTPSSSIRVLITKIG